MINENKKKDLKIVILICIIVIIISMCAGYFGWKSYFSSKFVDDKTNNKSLTFYMCSTDDNMVKYSKTKCSNEIYKMGYVTCKTDKCSIVNESLYPTIKDGNVYYLFDMFSNKKIYEGSTALYADDYGDGINFGVVGNKLLIVYNDNKKFGLYDITTKKLYEELVYTEIISYDNTLYILRSENNINNKVYNATTNQYVLSGVNVVANNSNVLLIKNGDNYYISDINGTKIIDFVNINSSIKINDISSNEKEISLVLVTDCQNNKCDRYTYNNDTKLVTKISNIECANACK